MAEVELLGVDQRPEDVFPGLAFVAEAVTCSSNPLVSMALGGRDRATRNSSFSISRIALLGGQQFADAGCWDCAPVR